VSGTAHVAPSVTTTGVNRLGLTVTAATAVTSMTPPAGSTERADQAGSAGAPTATIETSDFPQAAAGATGTKTTVTAAAATSTTATLTLRPASSGGTTKVSYVRDVTNRIVERKVNDVTVARYAFSSGGDTPDAELDVTNVIQRRTLGLMGGAVLSKATGSEIWSISNLHSDTIATLGSTGLVTGGPFTYDPFGKTIGGTPDNQIGLFDNGWLGQNQRPLEQQTGLRAVIEMGARIYDPQIGRFLQTDPIEGGTSNDYAYVEDPINEFDLSGMCKPKRAHGWLESVKATLSCAGSTIAKYDWGTTAAGAINVAYGGYKVYTGAALLRIAHGCAIAGPAGVAACYGLGAAQVATGAGRMYRGGRQLYGVYKSPRCSSNCGRRGNLTRLVKGIAPKWSGSWIEKLGGLF
jgi:RHS repeat-associated protein